MISVRAILIHDIPLWDLFCEVFTESPSIKQSVSVNFLKRFFDGRDTDESRRAEQLQRPLIITAANPKIYKRQHRNTGIHMLFSVCCLNILAYITTEAK